MVPAPARTACRLGTPTHRGSSLDCRGPTPAPAQLLGRLLQAVTPPTPHPLRGRWAPRGLTQLLRKCTRLLPVLSRPRPQMRTCPTREECALSTYCVLFPPLPLSSLNPQKEHGRQLCSSPFPCIRRPEAKRGDLSHSLWGQRRASPGAHPPAHVPFPMRGCVFPAWLPRSPFWVSSTSLMVPHTVGA